MDQTLPSRVYGFNGQITPLESEADDFANKFEVLHPLGRGSYGSVYKARVKETGEVVAVKVIPLTEQEDLLGIQKEINMLRDCNHPNVVKYFGSWRTPDSLWIAMEYCAGGSLSDVMHACDAPLEESIISYVCAETLAGLAYLHALGRIHRDIKCGNILLTEAGEVKLADFGVAAQLTSTLSKRNTFIGTPHWMAPEVIQASQYDGKVDMWALGISAIEMAERYPPRWRVNPNRVIFMVVRDPPPRLTDKERWSLTFQDFIAQCLQKDPRSRPTAKYLQQHRFLARDKSAAIRALLPSVQKARAMFAEAAAAALAAASTRGSQRWSSFGGNGTGTAYYQQSTGQMAGTMLMHNNGSEGSGLGGPSFLEATLPSSSQQRQLAGGGGGGTMVVHSSTDYYVSPLQLPTPSGNLADAAGATVLQRQLSDGVSPAAAAAALAAAEPSADYLAAVNAIDAGVGPLLSHDEGGTILPSMIRPTSSMAPAPGRGGGAFHYHRGAGGAAGGGNEAQRVAERLRNLHSSGEVVPLPFLKATDTCPLSLLGIDGGGAHRSTLPQDEADWEDALRQVLMDSSEDNNELPQSVIDRVQGSSTLLNVVTALMHRKQALEWQQREGASEAAQQQLKEKSEALVDTLRTVLCL